MRIREHWISLLYTAAVGSRKTRTLLTPIGLLVFGAFSAMFVFAALGVDRLLSLPDLVPEGARWALSIPIAATGGFVTGWSAFHFLRAQGTPVPFNPPPKVIDTGPYRFVRNPMLTGVFLLLFGIGFALNSVSLVLVFTPLYVLLNIWELRHIEEPELVRRLGETYINYRQQTPMFIPGLRSVSDGDNRG